MSDISTQRVDRALLIGVDKYIYIGSNLRGCVADVSRVRRYLIDALHTPESRIMTLTATLDGSEAPDDLATRAHIVDRFLRLGDDAQRGEQLYVHYSGHGMRNDGTLFPGLEADGRDEAIAPMDSGYEDPAARYLLDKELAWLLKRITDKGAHISVVMDCCHSASNTRDIVKVRRGQRRDARGKSDPSWEGGDSRPRPDSSLVAPLEELRHAVAAPEGLGGLRLLAPNGYVLITACREHETAKEYRENGVLTHFLLERLAKGTEGLTYRTLVDCTAAGIQELALSDSRFADQTPQLEGDGDLLVFGGGTLAERRAMIVVPRPNGTLLLTGGGAAAGLTVGSTVALYPPGSQRLDDHDAEVGVATVTRVDADSADAAVTGSLAGKLEPGMKAVVVHPGSAKVRRRIGIADGEPLARVRAAIARSGRDGKGSPYLDVVAPDDRPELLVAIEDGAYVIKDSRDKPLPRITPPLRAGDPASVDRLVQRLEHVVRYLNAWELHNDEPSSLRDGLAISVDLSSGRCAGAVALRPGDSIGVRVHNRTRQPLSATLLYFSPDWAIERIWPKGTDYTELAPTPEAGLYTGTLDAALGAGVERATERLKLIATVKPSSLAPLLLDSLDRPEAIAPTRGIENRLERMLREVAAGGDTRDLVRRVGAGAWTTAELVLETVR